MVREETLHGKITSKTRKRNCACAKARNSRNSRVMPTVLALIWNVNARLMCSIPCMMRLFYSQMSHQNKYHFNRVDSGLCRSINSCFFTSVFLLPEQMRSLKMKHKNFKRSTVTLRTHCGVWSSVRKMAIWSSQIWFRTGYPILYEGWNFNSVNYLFTTDTK